MKKAIYLCIGMLLFMGYANIHAAEIRGKVVDATAKEPIAGAYVYLENTQYVTTTDEDGFFTLQNIPAGTYQIKVWMLSYQEYVQKVQLKSNDVLNLTVVLPEAPLTADEIEVTGTPDKVVPQATIYHAQLKNEVVKDIGNFLRTQPGFSAMAKGGFGFDPVFRGYIYDQLNVQYDNGIRSSNACPNRMDPPSAHIQAEEIEKIEVIKGPFAVRSGPVMGGVINLVTRKAESTKKAVSVQAETGYESNGNGKKAMVMLSGRHHRADYYLSISRKIYGDYRDGANVVVPSSFNLTDYALKLGITPYSDHHIRLSFHRSLEKDVKFPTLPMDSKEVDNRMIALDYQVRNITPWLVQFSLKLYGTYSYHYMTNEGRLNFSMIHAYTPVYSENRGGRMEFKLTPLKGHVVYVGSDFYTLHKWGERQRLVYVNPCNGMQMNPPKEFFDKVWQDSRDQDLGLFAEWRWLASPVWTVIAGLRQDYVTATIGDPAAQFTALYGEANRFQDANTSATATVRYEGIHHTVVNLSVGRGTRSANITERFINHLTVGMDPFEYVGNPFLKPEVNNQVELGIQTQWHNHRFAGSVFYSYLQNYISAEIDSNIARLYMPCQDPRVAKRFINIERAMKYGFEFTVSGQLSSRLRYMMGAAYTYGQNLVHDAPLPFMPPLQGVFQLRYQAENQKWWSEVTTRMAARKTRNAVSLGEGTAPGFTVVNWLAGWKVHPYMEIYGGIYNVFNRHYYEFLNRPYKNLPIAGRITEPGRSIVVNFRLTL